MLEQVTRATHPATIAPQRTVLVIEDDDATALVVEDALCDAGYRVVRTRQGADAIDVLRHLTPDVVLVDLTLPIMDGRSFVEHYRRRVRPAASIVVMSSRADGADIARALGAEAYLPKPFAVDELLRKLSFALVAG